jgi:hypothetical protein
MKKKKRYAVYGETDDGRRTGWPMAHVDAYDEIDAVEQAKQKAKNKGFFGLLKIIAKGPTVKEIDD